MLLLPSPARAAYVRELEALEVQAPGRRVVMGLYKSPESGERLPAVIVLGGFETAGRVLDLLDPKKPVVLASFDYPFDGSKKFKFPRSLGDGGKLKAGIPRTLAAITELNARLRARAQVDPAKVCVLGASFGAPFALRAAAQDPKVSCVVLVHGFADVKGTMRHRLRQQWGFWGAVPAWLVSRLAWLYLRPPRPERDAASLRAGQRVLVIEAGQDTIIPAASRELLWRSLKSSQADVSRIVMPGDHLRPGSDAQIQEIMRLVGEWLH